MVRPVRVGGFLLAIGLATVTGCGYSVYQTGLNRPPHALVSRTLEEVDVFTLAPSTRPYVEVALLEAHADSVFSDSGPAAMIRELRRCSA